MRRRFAVFLAVVSCVALPVLALAQSKGDCKLKSGGSAHYECPPGYKLLLAGEGTDKCDGRCVDPAQTGALQKHLDLLLKEKALFLTDKEIDKLAIKLDAQGAVLFKQGDAQLTLKLIQGPK